MNVKAWATLQDKIVKDRARFQWAAAHADGAEELRRHGRQDAYDDLLNDLDRIMRGPDFEPADGWAEFRASVKRDRDLWYEQALDHGEMPGHNTQEERAYGRAEAYDEATACMDRIEREG